MAKISKNVTNDCTRLSNDELLPGDLIIDLYERYTFLILSCRKLLDNRHEITYICVLENKRTQINNKVIFPENFMMPDDIIFRVQIP